MILVLVCFIISYFWNFLESCSSVIFSDAVEPHAPEHITDEQDSRKFEKYDIKADKYDSYKADGKSRKGRSKGDRYSSKYYAGEKYAESAQKWDYVKSYEGQKYHKGGAHKGKGHVTSDSAYDFQKSFYGKN